MRNLVTPPGNKNTGNGNIGKVVFIFFIKISLAGLYLLIREKSLNDQLYIIKKASEYRGSWSVTLIKLFAW